MNQLKIISLRLGKAFTAPVIRFATLKIIDSLPEGVNKIKLSRGGEGAPFLFPDGCRRKERRQAGRFIRFIMI